MNALELNAEYIRRTRTVRMDLVALADFVKARVSGSGADETKLFWEMWRPRAFYLDATAPTDGFDEKPQLLPDDIEAALLEELANLERSERMPYQPDASDPLDFSGAIDYIHIAAAMALRHQARDGYSDNVRQTLDEVRRVLHLADMKPSLASAGEAPMGIVSLWAVSALAMSALSRIKYLDGEYEDAFQLAIEALEGFEAVSLATDIEAEWLVEAGSIDEDSIQEEQDFRATLGSFPPLLNLEPQEVVNTFERLRLRGKAESWRLVALRCRVLALTTDDELREARVLDEDGEEEIWDVYWHRAQGWAEAQLGQNELREYLRWQEQEAGENRLKRYFFGECWDKIPQRAREHLVNVDLLWFSDARIGLEDILNDLQVAAETMCNTFVWEPLQKAKGGHDLLEFMRTDDYLKSKRLHPTLPNYVWVCRQSFFRAFLKNQGVSEREQRFLTSELHIELDNLRKSRDLAQHDPKKRWRREEVEPFVQSFLGIGKPGVLRSLAEVGPKLMPK